MNNEQRAIVGLVAAGRITAAEAERLFRAWNDGRESIWIGMVCLVACLMQFHPQISMDGVGHWAHWAVTEWSKYVQTAGGVLLKGMGGRL